MNCIDVLREIFDAYNLSKDKYIGKRAITRGHINTTYVLYFDYGCRVKRYLLQEINTNIFKNPEGLMNNIEKITLFYKNKLKKYGIPNYKNHTLRIFNSIHGKSYYVTSSGHYFRIYHYIEGAVTHQIAENSEMFKNAGHAIGVFQNILHDFPAEELCEVIPNFHNTPARFEVFKKAIADDKVNRVHTCKKEIDYMLSHKDMYSLIVNMLNNHEIPTRVTHNDTKLNNVMFDSNDDTGLCLIDLDTVMPGSFLYDFGDAIRSGCNPVEEDEKNLNKVVFMKHYFEAFANGYLSAVAQSITPKEVENLTNGAIIITLECGMRFLTDYLDGDNYFKISYPEQNLVRARTQIHMAQQMLDMKDELDAIITKAYHNALEKLKD